MSNFIESENLTCNNFFFFQSAPSDPVNGPHGEGYDPSNYESNIIIYAEFYSLDIIIIHTNHSHSNTFR